MPMSHSRLQQVKCHPMDPSRCSRCRRRLIASSGKTGRTEMVCLICDEIDPMKTVAMKWAQSNLSPPGPQEKDS
jgi:hypothetical protein